MNTSFENKWSEILSTKDGDEFSLFVPPGQNPATQRQLNLYSYYEFIREVIKDKGYSKSLEMGCGRGTMSCYLNVYSGFETTLMDLSPEAVDLAKRNYELLQLEGRYIVGDSKQTGEDDNSYDLVCSIGLLEHIDDYDKILAETFRILKPGGMIISLNIPRKNSIQRVNGWYRAVRSIGSREAFQKDYYRNSDKPGDYLRHTNEAGFTGAYTINVCPFPIITPLSLSNDRRLTRIYKTILWTRRLFMTYPFKCAYPVAQAHFLVGTKPAESLPSPE